MAADSSVNASKTWMVLVDGSDIASMGFDLSLRLMKHDAGEEKNALAIRDNMLVLHLFDSAKYSYLPVAYRHDSIRSKYETLLVTSVQILLNINTFSTFASSR